MKTLCIMKAIYHSYTLVRIMKEILEEEKKIKNVALSTDDLGRYTFLALNLVFFGPNLWPKLFLFWPKSLTFLAQIIVFLAQIITFLAQITTFLVHF